MRGPLDTEDDAENPDFDPADDCDDLTTPDDCDDE